MSFDHEQLPEPASYYEAQGLVLKGPRNSKWRTTACQFHGGSDSLRVNMATGAWVCMSCGEKGGDVLAYQMKAHGQEFVAAAQALGAWVDDKKPHRPWKPTALPPRAALEVLAFETTIVAVCAGNMAKGIVLTDIDRKRLMTCASRICRLAEDFAS